MKHKLFGTQTGLPASELIMGGSNLGNRRGYGSTPQDALQILSAYVDAGGNFIDVSDTYQFGEAEEIVGRFTEHKRHDFILCSKYTRSSHPEPSLANTGNHRKAMRQAIEGSLKRLRTDYIDIYIPHFDDGITPLEEIARGLEDLVASGKVLYTGLANFPAWKAAAIAAVIPLTAMQIEYNLLQRAPERELTAMAKHFGLGMMCYSPLAGGLLTGKYRQGASGRLTLSAADGYHEDERTKTVIDELELIARELNATPGQIALAWVLSKEVFPIIGTRTLGHLEAGLTAVAIRLEADQIRRLDEISAIAMGYPHDLLATVQKKW
ncbi:aldo/keto reductase [Cytophagaceae bacterium YF14B1]|uniref:Aldo/keto reductase n=1 Tax=Xanthocytophaga flava TaxID=3048013 RepID=A0AAE3U7C6_9BACT|nr:aldo/keto reductase [Xanthocytophaga flavus]MDJ1482266.1 aldo/keto reductase [Xanthocytophaga flavus]